MSIHDDLKRMAVRMEDQDFLQNKGLSNEVGIHVFPYNPEYEPIVTEFIEKLKSDKTRPYNLIECDLYEIFLQICEDKKILDKIPTMEDTRGKEYLLTQLQKIATPEMFVERMDYDNHKPGDILLITGVGKVFPYMRSHKILDNIQHIFSDIPVVMFYPGKYDGQNLKLFDKFSDANYYRAFNLI